MESSLCATIEKTYCELGGVLSTQNNGLDVLLGPTVRAPTAADWPAAAAACAAMMSSAGGEARRLPIPPPAQAHGLDDADHVLATHAPLLALRGLRLVRDWVFRQGAAAEALEHRRLGAPGDLGGRLRGGRRGPGLLLHRGGRRRGLSGAAVAGRAVRHRRWLHHVLGRGQQEEV